MLKFFPMMKRFLLLYPIVLSLLAGCSNTKPQEIIIFHAGSLSVPFKELAEKYEERNPGVNILMEPAGSLVCARKITELKKPCDIIASADYFVINKFIVPDYASWSIRFATNKMVISFQEKARYASEIDSSNWMEIIQRKDVKYSRSDPDSDPCGYRTVILFKLAERYYNVPGLADRLIAKDKDFIRPKESDLIALIESNSADYMFQYKSVAIQHNLKYIELPDEINLGDPRKNDLYSTVNIDVVGSTPGSRITVTGEYINYSLAVLKDAISSVQAIDFIAFILSKEGMEIFRKNGQEPIIPFSTEQEELLPEKLKSYLIAPEGQKNE
jgi:molybdate/tungstate transport system substrate-binding protein